jgi:hypothetical protein
MQRICLRKLTPLMSALVWLFCAGPLAKNLLSEFHRKRIIAQVEADGRQPRELTRMRAWDYSLFNLQALFDAASIAGKLSIDLWSPRSDDQRSIRRALDWLVPFATGERKWTYPQITRFQPEKLAPLPRRAGIVYRDPAYERVIGSLKTSTGNERWQLLYPKMGQLD